MAAIVVPQTRNSSGGLVPYTLNGIGTRYVGAKNRSATVGDCESCKKSATLSSYDTREWFCFAYIPLIPLTKYRILNDCSRRGRHRRLKSAAFQESVNQKLAPLREAIRRSPRDPQPYAALVHTLVAWQMRSEAQQELESAGALVEVERRGELIPADCELSTGQQEIEVVRKDRRRRLE